MTMTASLRALLTEIIDYAGLFPPARLPLDEAIRNYARYRQESNTWMLGRFVIPAARLAELAPYDAELFHSGAPFAFTALGRGGATAEEFHAGLGTDLRDIAAFRARHGERVTVDVLETRLPVDADVRAIAQRTRSAGLFLFGEGDSRLIERLATAHAAGEQVGYKLRCGGLEAAAFPTSEQIAAVLIRCREAGVPLKATAGLHHPLPRYDAGLQVKMHGFINLFLAGVLVHLGRLDDEQVRDLLADDDPAHFVFSEEAASWRGTQATTAEIGAARREAILSFGSCSFDEPLEDLRSLHWL
jgi:hypothetical protein